MYDATLGRFLSRDPIESEAGSVDLYAYVDANPADFSDPTGLLVKYSAHFSNWASATDDELIAYLSHVRSQYVRKDLQPQISAENVRDLIQIATSSRSDEVRGEARACY